MTKTPSLNGVSEVFFLASIKIIEYRSFLCFRMTKERSSNDNTLVSSEVSSEVSHSEDESPRVVGTGTSPLANSVTNKEQVEQPAKASRKKRSHDLSEHTRTRKSIPRDLKRRSSYAKDEVIASDSTKRKKQDTQEKHNNVKTLEPSNKNTGDTVSSSFDDLGNVSRDSTDTHNTSPSKANTSTDKHRKSKDKHRKSSDKHRKSKDKRHKNIRIDSDSSNVPKDVIRHRKKKPKSTRKRLFGWFTKRKHSRRSSGDYDNERAQSFDVTAERMAEMEPKTILRAFRKALKAFHPKALALFTRLYQTHSDEINIEKEVSPRHMHKLALLAMVYVDKGPTPLLTVLRAMNARKRSRVQVDSLYTKTTFKGYHFISPTGTDPLPYSVLDCGQQTLVQ